MRRPRPIEPGTALIICGLGGLWAAITWFGVGTRVGLFGSIVMAGVFLAYLVWRFWPR